MATTRARMRTNPPPGALEDAARLLLDRADEIAMRHIATVWRDIPGYTTVLVDRHQLRDFVAPNLRMVLSVIADRRPPTAEETERARSLGTRRALQGVPEAAVMRSFQMAERAVGERLVELCHDAGFEETQRVLRAVGDAFDQLVSTALDAYHEAQADIVARFGSEGANLVGRLATGIAVQPDEIVEQARMVQCDPWAPHQAIALAVVPGLPTTAITSVRQAILARLSEHVDGTVLSGTVSGRLVMLIPRTGMEPIDIAPILVRALEPSQQRYDALIGLGRTSPMLANVGLSCQQALAAVDVGLRKGEVRRVVGYDEILVDSMLAQHREVSQRLIESRIGAILDKPHLLETLQVYLDNDVSMSAAAKELVLHPNTVAYRLQRIKELTGADPRCISDVLDLSLALRALRMLS